MASTKHDFMMGLILSVITTLFWGMLPIAIKLTSEFADPVTLTWVRFTFAAFVVFVWQWHSGQLSQIRNLTGHEWFRLCVTGLLLIVNYTAYAWGLSYLSPEVGQLGMQVSPLFLALGGLLFLHERISWQQWACIMLVMVGLLIFFHPVLTGNYQGDMHSLLVGLGIIFIASLSWSIYALTQKTLFKKLSSSNLLLVIYVLALVVMFPFATPSELKGMSHQNMWVLAFCCMNTLVAYGAFTQSLRYWETVQVSSVISVVPVVSFLLTALCVALGLWPSVIHQDPADILSIAGMVLVVIAAIGVQIATVGGRPRPRHGRKLRSKAKAKARTQTESTAETGYSTVS